MTELKNSRESFKSKLNYAEERTNDLGDKTFEIIHQGRKKKE